MKASVLKTTTRGLLEQVWVVRKENAIILTPPKTLGFILFRAVFCVEQVDGQKPRRYP